MDVCVLVYPRKNCHAYIELYFMPEIIMGITWYLRNIDHWERNELTMTHVIYQEIMKKVATFV